jgi:hypothetical protein
MGNDKLTFNMRVRTPGGIGLVKERVVQDGQEIGVMVCHSVDIPEDVKPEVRRRTSPCVFKIYQRSELEVIND